jgi:hypothetical protein
MFCVDLLAGYHCFVHTALQSISEFADIPYIPVSINLAPMLIALIVVLRVLPKGQAAIFNLTDEARIVETDRLRVGAESYALMSDLDFPDAVNLPRLRGVGQLM